MRPAKVLGAVLMVAVVSGLVLLLAPGHAQAAVTCPAQDNDGFVLGQSVVHGTTLFCSYPRTPGENPNDHFCGYDTSTGVLDSSESFNDNCPSNAAGTPDTQTPTQTGTPTTTPTP